MAVTSYQKKKYVQSDAVTQAQTAMQTQQAAKPAAYTSQWQGQMNDTMGKILSRNPFEYDINADAMYQQAVQNYVQQGKQAMMDTMGQEQAMTGGYGNSYAQMAGQQAYQGHLQGLNDLVPDYYQMALNKYLMEGDQLTEQFGLLANQENTDYSRYRDGMSDWNAEMDRLYQQWMNERNFDYGKYADDLAYNQWLREFTEDKRRYDHQNGLGEFAVAPGVGGGAAVMPSGGSGGSGKNGSYSADTRNSGGTPDIAAEYLAMKKAGAKSTETDKYLKSAISAGLISQKDATELRDTRY